MKDPRIDPIEPELTALLDAERDAPVADDALDRVWSKMAVVPALGAAGAGHAGSGVVRAGWPAAKVAALGASLFLAGGGIGAAITHATQGERERVVYVERLAAPAPPASVVAPLPSATVSAPVPTPHASDEPETDSSLVRERRILDAARSALAGGDAAGALDRLDQHAHRFGKPQLGEEREALAVQALVALGRYDEARARASRLRAAAPGSLFLPVVDAALQSIP